MNERNEALMRIVVLIVSGLILGVWKGLVQIIWVVNWVITIVTGKRSRGLAEFVEIWNTQLYVFMQYINFVTNKRPFPFEALEKNMTRFSR